jgi:hypothetical protein
MKKLWRFLEGAAWGKSGVERSVRGVASFSTLGMGFAMEVLLKRFRFYKLGWIEVVTILFYGLSWGKWDVGEVVGSLSKLGFWGCGIFWMFKGGWNWTMGGGDGECIDWHDPDLLETQRIYDVKLRKRKEKWGN